MALSAKEKCDEGWMRLRTLMACASASVLVTGVSIGGIGLWLDEGVRAGAESTTRIVQTQRASTNASALHEASRSAAIGALLSSSIGDRARASVFVDELKRTLIETRTAIAAAAGPAPTPKLLSLIADIGTHLDIYDEAAKDIAAASALGDATAARTLLEPFEDAAGPVAAGFATLATEIDAFGASTSDEMARQNLASALDNWIAIALSLGLAAGLLLVSHRFISRPLREVSMRLQALAAGDTTVEPQRKHLVDEFERMSETVFVFRDALRSRDRLSDQAEKTAHLIAARVADSQMLNRRISQVVDAASAGDFSGRVDAGFPEAELNALAEGVNRLVQTIDTRLSETSTVLAAIARAELTHRVSGSYEGAFRDLKDHTNAVADRLSEIIGNLKATSTSLKTATSEILAGANDLAERTNKQASTIQQTGATMEQLAATVMQNSDRAGAASAGAAQVSQSAEDGGRIMARATEAMQRITIASSKISNIIGLIDDIAFQTNLLAINASVEAARAGEAGKGFAVVAVEVRRLAQSAAQASSQVKVLIDQSAGEVKAGSKLVGDAADKLSAMLDSVRENTLLLESIARQSRDQAHSINEVNVAVRDMEEMTQQNAALVEETNAAIEQTEAQASELDRIVDIFTLGDLRPQPAKPQPALALTPAPTPERRERLPLRRSAPATDIRTLQAKLSSAARSYLGRAGSAPDPDWSEF